MEFLIYILAFFAIVALVARLYLRYHKVDDESNPVFPCVIEISDSIYFQDWRNDEGGMYPVSTVREDRAATFNDEKSYASSLARLREWGYRKSRWKVVARRTFKVVR